MSSSSGSRALAETVAQQQAQFAQLVNEFQRLREEVQALQTAMVQYVSKPMFGAKKVKLDLPGKFDGKPSALNAWIFEVEQYCKIVSMNSVTDMVKLAVSCLEKDAHTWWRQLTAKSMDYELGHLGWNEFKGEIEIAFADVDRELKLRRQLSALRQTASVAAYTKEFCRLALELGNQVPDDSALMFMYVEGLKPAVKMQVLLARPIMLVEAEVLAERADIAIFASEQQHFDNQPRRFQGRDYQRPRTFQPPRQPQRPVPMDLSMVQRWPQMPPCGGPSNGSRPNRKFSGQCYHCGRPGHKAKDCWHCTSAGPQPYQGKSAFMGAQVQDGYYREYGVVLRPPPPAGQPPAPSIESQPKN